MPKESIQLFRAIVRFYSTNRQFTLISSDYFLVTKMTLLGLLSKNLTTLGNNGNILAELCYFEYIILVASVLLLFIVLFMVLNR